MADRDAWIKQILPTIPRLEPISSMAQDMDTEIPDEAAVPPGPTQNNWASLSTPVHRGHTPPPALTLGTRTPWGLSRGTTRRISQPASSHKTASMNQTGENDLELHARGLADTGTSIGTAGESQLLGIKSLMQLMGPQAITQVQALLTQLQSQIQVA